MISESMEHGPRWSYFTQLEPGRCQGRRHARKINYPRLEYIDRTLTENVALWNINIAKSSWIRN